MSIHIIIISMSNEEILILKLEIQKDNQQLYKKIDEFKSTIVLS